VGRNVYQSTLCVTCEPKKRGHQQQQQQQRQQQQQCTPPQPQPQPQRNGMSNGKGQGPSTDTGGVDPTDGQDGASLRLYVNDALTYCFGTYPHAVESDKRRRSCWASQHSCKGKNLI